jgi:hypothetical protein
MERLKKVVPILLGMFLLISGTLLYTSQEAEARRGEANCVYDPVGYDCYDTSKFNCICIDVPPIDP